MSRALIDRAAGRKSKYGVRLDAVGKMRRTLDGVVYDSAVERDHAAELVLRQKAGHIRGWARQQNFKLEVNGVHIAYHRVDFVVNNLDGTDSIEEVKGAVTDSWRIKHRLFTALFPHIPYIVIPARKLR